MAKKTPCNGCRERKRKCTYQQPCERCVKAGVECTYTVMPSPKDMEYIQELEYMNQIDAIQQEITCMENEINKLKLAKENGLNQLDQQPKAQSPTVHNLHDYPSPVSLGKPMSASFDEHFHHHHRHKHRHQEFMFLQDPFIDYEGLPQSQQQPQYPPSRLFDDSEKCMQMERCYTHKRGRKRHHRHVIKSNNIQVELKSQQQQDESKPWSLTVKNGNMTIETFISSHEQLMNCLGGMVSTAVYQEKTSKPPFPFHVGPVTHATAINKVLSILTWRKYGKSRFKSLTKYTPVLMHSVAPQELTRIIPVEGLQHITMRLVLTYFQCHHLRHFALYIPEFVNAFMHGDLLSSPVVMALCSNLCQQCCRHTIAILPPEAIGEYGLYYFEQARELIKDKFDEISIETLITFTFMAMYKLKTKDDLEAGKYLAMAERIYHLLLPLHEYKPSSDKAPTGESMLFSRIFRCMQHCRSIIELHDAMNRMFRVRGMGHHKLFKLLDSQDHVKIHVFPGDSPREIQFIKMRHYVCMLRQVIKDGATRCVAATDFSSYISVFGHQIEMAMRHWYRKVLPDTYQLSLPLFDDNISDLDFFTTLEKECQESPIPLLTTAALYNEYLIMAKSYVPKNPAQAQLDTEELIKKFKHMQYDTTSAHDTKDRHGPSAASYDHAHSWLKVIEKLEYFKRHHQEQFSDHQQSDEEYLTQFIRALNPSRINFDMPLIHTSVKSALNTVRLVQFLVSRDCACFLDVRWIMNAWQVLLRAARFRYQQPGDKTVTLDRIRANLILCLSIVKEQLDFNHNDPDGEFMLEMNQQFEELYA